MGPLNSEIYSNALTSYFSTSITKYPEIAEKTDYWRFLKNLKSETKGPTSSKGLLPVTSYVREVKRTGEKKKWGPNLLLKESTAQNSFVKMAQYRLRGWEWHKYVTRAIGTIAFSRMRLLCLNNNLSIRPHISVSPYQESHFDLIAYEYTLNPIYSIYYDFRLWLI